MIFVQLILDNFGDHHFSALVIGQKQRRKKEEERIKIYVNMRENVVSKVVKKWYKYHLFSE